jgi:cytochrome c-type biogenesis protein CcmH/NrfG
MPGRLCRFELGMMACVLCLGLAAQAENSQARGAIDSAPAGAEAARLNNLGVAMMNQQLMEKAVAKFDAALKADPFLLTAQLNRGIALLNQQKLTEAEAALQDVLKKKPSNARAWYNLGLAHRGDGNTITAIDDFQHAAKLAPNDADVYYFLGALYSQQQDYPQAIENFEHALKLQPLHASAEFGLAKALQRSGKPDFAKLHLQKFEHLTQTKVSSPITLSYGEQGRLSIAEDIITNEPAVGPMIPVKFTAQEVAAGGGSPKSGDRLMRDLGGGICLLDVDGDGKLDIVSLSGRNPSVDVFRNLGSGKWQLMKASETGLPADGPGISCAVGDYDNDGKNDLALSLGTGVLLFRNDGNGKFTDVTKTAGIESPQNWVPAGITFVDYDHDGDLDLFATGFQPLVAGSLDSLRPNVLWRNNGNQTFTNWTTQAGLEGKGATTAATLSDINNDRAVDLVVAGSGSAPTLYINPRAGNFTDLPLYEVKGLPPTTGVYVFDFDKDGWMDVALTHDGAPGLTLWQNKDGEHFERVNLPLNAKKSWGITAIDFDNDGWLDLAAIVETHNGPELRVLRNQAQQGFEDVSAQLGLDKIKLNNPRALIAADIDGDRAPDLIVAQLGGDPVILHNQGGNKNHALKIDLKGLADNKTAIGTKVEVFAGGLWQKFEIPGAAGYLSQGSPEILAGLGKADKVDIVRMLWPTGVIQDEVELAADKPVSFMEIDRRGSSCPTLFVWNGEKYEFISDVIGAAVMGHWISPTEKNIPDPDEWIKIEGSQIQPRDGYLSVRFGEPMEEANYIDQLRMIAVDHPAATEVYPDERFLDNPPFATGKPVSTSAPHPPLTAWDTNGNDVLQRLTKHDHQYVRDFTNLQYAGFANLHSLRLDLGKWTPARPLRLFLAGFIEYFSATSMYAAWQAGLQPISPYVEAQIPDGSWKRVIDDMGFPAGLPRTIVVDLTGKLLPGTRRIRISTNLQIYWDQVLVDNGPERTGEIRTTELPLASATLAFRGYPQQLDQRPTPGDLEYRYELASTTGPFSKLRGSYTNYGDVTDLLKNVDDHFVVFGTGEDIDAEFDTVVLPPLPAGWKRDYFLYANGFVKDMDFYEATPFTVAQYPFHAMTSYPYPATEHYSEDRLATDYLLEWNGRFETGEPNASGYRFVYAPRQIDPLPLTPSKAGANWKGHGLIRAELVPPMIPVNAGAAWKGHSFSCAEPASPSVSERASAREACATGGGR